MNLGVVVHARGDLRVQDVPLAGPAPHETVVDIAFGGVCGSDLHYWLDGAAGQSILREPLLLGHEVVGTVGVAAADGSGPPVGTPVAVHPAGTADASAPHPPGRPNISAAVTYLGSAARLPHTQGAFAQRVVLAGSMLRPLPDGLDLRTAAVAEPAAVAWHAVARAGELAGRRVLVIGCGPIGALIVAVAVRAGAAEVVAVDVHEHPRTIARTLGATRTLEADGAEGVAADVVFEASGHPSGLASAVRGAARGGRVVLVGLPPPGDQPVAVSLAISRELDVLGSFRFVDEIDDVLAALADGSLRTAPVVTHEFAMADALEAFEVARDPRISGKVLLRFRSGA